MQLFALHMQKLPSGKFDQQLLKIILEEVPAGIVE